MEYETSERDGWFLRTGSRFSWRRSVAHPSVPPGNATLVGDGVISTRDYEQNSSFTADGRTLYFTKRSLWPAYASVLCESHLVNGRWSEPTVLPFSGRDYDSDPFVTADGSRLYFASRRPVDGHEHRDRDIWYADRTAAGWSAPERLPAPVNSNADEAYPVLVKDGSLYFTSSPRDSTAQQVDTYRAQWMGDHFATPVELAGDSDRVYGRLQAFVSPDETYMVFVSWQDDDTKTASRDLQPGRSLRERTCEWRVAARPPPTRADQQRGGGTCANGVERRAHAVLHERAWLRDGASSARNDLRCARRASPREPQRTRRHLSGAHRNARTGRWNMSTVTWRIPGLVAMMAAMTGARVSPPPFLREPGDDRRRCDLHRRR